MKDELKQRGARLYSNKFIYVTPKGLLHKDEVPLWAGLWEIDVESIYANEFCSFHEIIPAPVYSKAIPSWSLICSIVRKINKEKLATDIVSQKDKEISDLKQQISKLERQLMERWFSVEKQD